VAELNLFVRSPLLILLNRKNTAFNVGAEIFKKMAVRLFNI
jgi:hypothetical protein